MKPEPQPMKGSYSNPFNLEVSTVGAISKGEVLSFILFFGFVCRDLFDSGWARSKPQGPCRIWFESVCVDFRFKILRC